MSAEEVAHWRHRLRDEERRLGARYESEDTLLANEDEGLGQADDAAAWASREGTYDFLQGQEQSQTRALREIGDAWRRLDAGAYGRCEICGEDIPRARLEAVPYTRYCLRHAQAQ